VVEGDRGVAVLILGLGLILIEVLARFGTQAQKDKYLGSLLNGVTRSSFSMTELGGGYLILHPIMIIDRRVAKICSGFIRRYQPQKHDSRSPRLSNHT
jgi:hypothetical protein